MSPGRRETLEKVLNAILFFERDEAIRLSVVWRPTEGTRKAELRLDCLYVDILAGRGKLEAFKKGCVWWRESGINITPGLPGIKMKEERKNGNHRKSNRKQY